MGVNVAEEERLRTAAQQQPPAEAEAAAREEEVRRAVAECPVLVVGRRGCCLSHVVKRLLQGLGVNPAAGSKKSLVYSPTVRNKRATFALVCQTLKCHTSTMHNARCTFKSDNEYTSLLGTSLFTLKPSTLKEASTGLLNSKWKVHAILLDPSCSGSGISTERLDYLLPSHSRGTKGFCSNSPALLFRYLLKKDSRQLHCMLLGKVNPL